MNQEIFVKMSSIDGWQGQINATNKLFGKLSDEELMQEVSRLRAEPWHLPAWAFSGGARHDAAITALRRFHTFRIAPDFC